jgi:hypothetical protein
MKISLLCVAPSKRGYLCQITILFALSVALATLANGQNYLQQMGIPTFSVNQPVPMGEINVANGNLHLEIPISSTGRSPRLIQIRI